MWTWLFINRSIKIVCERVKTTARRVYMYKHRRMDAN